MTPEPSSHRSAPVATAPAKRSAPDLGRAGALNRLYILAMFAVIVAIGSLGIFALARSQQSSDVVDHSFELANDATAMGTALDREHSELALQILRHSGKTSARFAVATGMFKRALGEAKVEGWASSQELLNVVAPRHAAFLADSGAIAGALSRGDRALATRIEAERVTPNINAIRQQLDEISAKAYQVSVVEDAKDQRFSQLLQHVVLAVTVVGLALMAGLAVLLGRYKRRAEAAATAMVAALEQAALTDNLTGLGNNRSFYDDFEREIARAKRYDHSMVLALLDIDDFKTVNDESGHSHGDEVLADIGQRLRTMRQGDRGYRIGGDEFALILVETDPAGGALAIERLQAQIRESALGATVSIGYVNLAGGQLDAESYELADTALYEAKRLGRNQTVCFEEIRGTVSVFSPRKADAVRSMIAQGLVSTAFQPIWDMHSTRPLGFEALARPSPELALSGPQEAFDIAQRIRQLPELDMLCTRKALEAAANLPPGSVVFLNYSPASLTHASFDPKAFVEKVRVAGLLPGQIVIELTERRIDEPALVAQRAAALRALGVRIALDDTGTGHAGLEILSKVRFDFVKIDRELVIDAMRSAAARGVLAGIIAIARETGSYLIAEGIETREMLEFVRSAHSPKNGDFAGILGIQGFLLGRPEVGGPDLKALEQNHDFLAARRLEERIAGIRPEAESRLYASRRS